MDIHIYSLIFFFLVQSLPAGKEYLCAADTKGQEEITEGHTNAGDDE